MEFEIDQLASLKDPVEYILPLLEKYKVLLLEGDLGAGKTTFASVLVKALGVEEEPSSPTFSIVNEYVYKGQSGAQQIIYHIDLYRLNSIEEALNIGIEDYFYSGNICLIEWPNIVESLLPLEHLTLKIERTGESSRKIRIFNSEKSTN